MKLLAKLCLALCAWILMQMMMLMPAQAEPASITLGLREQRNLNVPSTLERIAVADPEIADVVILRPSHKQKSAVMLVGKKPGTTTLTIWSGNGAAVTSQVTVLSNLQTLNPQSGAKLQVAGDAAVISGQSPSLLDHVATTTAAMESAGEKKLIDTATIATSPVVQIDVKIVEFSKTGLKEAGFNFLFNAVAGGFNFNLVSNLTNSNVTTPIASAFNLTVGNKSGNRSASLRLIEGNGLARVLASPSLTALSGQSASFLAGGELPIPVAGGLGTTTIMYKPFGIGLTVTPTVLASNRIALKVAPEASEIDYSNAIVSDGVSIPAITTRRADTTLELGDGESFVIGGLVSRTTRSNVSKVPFLGDLPIIGTFFRSMTYTQDEKELVIIVTPHLIRPIAKDTPLPLPGEKQERRNSPGNAWGSYLMGISSKDDLPGFSR